MQNRLSRLSLTLLALVLGAASSAQAAYVYLNPRSLDLRDFPAPPAPGSRADDRDLDGVWKLQATRTKGECKRAFEEAYMEAETFFGPRRGILSANEVDLIDELFEDVSSDTREFNSSLKNIFRRLRPFQVDPKIELCVPLVKGFSYPSGHAALGRSSALVLALIFPERRNAILHRGDEIGFDRVIGGVHHPLDIEAGRRLGDQVYDALIKSREFMHRIDKLREKRRTIRP